MKRWVLFQQKAYQKPDFTIDYCNYGDWVDGSWIKGTPDKRTTSRPLMSTAYYYNNCRIVARAARLLGKDDDAKQFGDLADRVKAAFNARFFNPKTNKYESETQGSYVFPLAFGLVPEEHRAAVITNLVDEIQIKHKGHTSVGLVGMQWFMQVADRCRPPGRGLYRRHADDSSELGLHGLERCDDELGALGHRHPGRWDERREPEDPLRQPGGLVLSDARAESTTTRNVPGSSTSSCVRGPSAT